MWSLSCRAEQLSQSPSVLDVACLSLRFDHRGTTDPTSHWNQQTVWMCRFSAQMCKSHIVMKMFFNSSAFIDGVCYKPEWQSGDCRLMWPTYNTKTFLIGVVITIVDEFHAMPDLPFVASPIPFSPFFRHAITGEPVWTRASLSSACHFLCP